jgi:predicted RNA-binding Zn ribbon-like protein
MRRMHQDAVAARLEPAVPGEAASVALALVNTRLDGPTGPLDLLAGAADARAWLIRHGLAPGSGRSDGAWEDRLRGLRESVRGLFAARIDGVRPDPADLAAVNAALAAAPCVTSVAWDGDGPRVGRRRIPRTDDPLAPALAALAADAGDLLTGAHAEQLARCSAHRCIRMFIRTHAARQVCSTRCGDRVRAARHYAKRREQAAP